MKLPSPIPKRTVMVDLCRASLRLLLLLAAASVPAQEALQNLQAGNAAAQARAQDMTALSKQDYTYKNGDFRVLATPTMSLQYNDNINLAGGTNNVKDDVIINPSVGLRVSYPFSEKNLLYLDFNFGYEAYVKNSALSTFDVNSTSGTGLSFDLGIKDVNINFHDWVQYVQGSGQGNAAANTADGAVANTASYGTFQNTVGLLGTWDLNQFNLSLGYDHQNVLATSTQFNQINHSSEMVTARAGFQFLPQLSAGLEASASLTSYQETKLNDNGVYTVGPYVEFHPGRYLTISARAGYSTEQFQNTSTALTTTGSNFTTASQNSWYANLNITHEPADFLSYTFSVGREVQLGIQSDLLEDWYVRPTVTWKVMNGLDITTAFFFEHGTQGVGSDGSLAGGVNDTFDWYGGSLGIHHPLTSWLDLSLNYQLTFRTSNTPNDEYTQNLVGLQLTYHPK